MKWFNILLLAFSLTAVASLVGNAGVVVKRGPKSDSVVYDVSKYGTFADGVTNDSDAINAAVSAACDAGGGTIWVPKGIYAVGTTGGSQFYSGVRLNCNNLTFSCEAGAEFLWPASEGGRRARLGL